MKTWRDVAHLLRHPDDFLEQRLRSTQPLVYHFVYWLVPLALVRPVAVLLRSLILDAPITSGVLATSSVALQLGTWVAVSLMLPSIAHQFRTTLRERDCLLLVGLASMPLWAAGALYIVPDVFSFLYWWSRTLVFVIALYGVFVAYRAFVLLKVEREARWPLLVTTAIAYGAVYLVLFTLLGISSHVILYALDAAR